MGMTRSSSPIRIALVEDDAQLTEELLEQLHRQPDLTVVGQAAAAADAVHLITAQPVDVVVTDIKLPGPSGIDLVRDWKPRMPQTQFLVLTMFDDDDLVFSALRAGATGYVLKRDLRRELISAIRDLHAGGSPMSSAIARKVVRAFQHEAADREEGLSPRESELLNWLVRGRSYKECADLMSIKPSTLNTYIRRLYTKLQAHSRHEAIAKARRDFRW